MLRPCLWILRLPFTKSTTSTTRARFAWCSLKVNLRRSTQRRRDGRTGAQPSTTTSVCPSLVRLTLGLQLTCARFELIVTVRRLVAFTSSSSALGIALAGPHSILRRVYGSDPCEPPSSVSALNAGGSTSGSPTPKPWERTSTVAAAPASRPASPESQYAWSVGPVDSVSEAGSTT